jgi:hypothetical protein
LLFSTERWRRVSQQTTTVEIFGANGAIYSLVGLRAGSTQRTPSTCGPLYALLAPAGRAPPSGEPPRVLGAAPSILPAAASFFASLCELDAATRGTPAPAHGQPETMQRLRRDIPPRGAFSPRSSDRTATSQDREAVLELPVVPRSPSVAFYSGQQLKEGRWQSGAPGERRIAVRCSACLLQRNVHSHLTELKTPPSYNQSIYGNRETEGRPFAGHAGHARS